MSENEQIIFLLVKVVKNLKKLRKRKKSLARMGDSNYNPADWALMAQVLKQLSISKSTLYRYRKNKKVRWEQKIGLSYYYLPDLLKLKNRCMK